MNVAVNDKHTSLLHKVTMTISSIS